MNLKSIFISILRSLGITVMRNSTYSRLVNQAKVPDPTVGAFSHLNSLDIVFQPDTDVHLIDMPKAVDMPTKIRTVSWLQVFPATNEPDRFCNSLVNQSIVCPSEGWKSENANEFFEFGFTRFVAKFDKASKFAVSEVFNRSFMNQHPSWEWAGNSIMSQSYDAVMQGGLPSPTLIQSLHNMFADKWFDNFFKKIMGCSMTIANCRLVLSNPHSNKGEGPQSWHEDGSPPGVLRGLIYLTDVDENAGPFQYYSKTGNIISILGQAGDLLIFDAMRLKHRASPPLKTARKAIDIVFMPRMQDQPIQCLVSGVNHWPADPFVFSIPKERIFQKKSEG